MQLGYINVKIETILLWLCQSLSSFHYEFVKLFCLILV